MTQEDKNLLLKDICARLPYRVIIKYKAVDSISRHTELTDSCIDYIRNIGFGWKECKPYLRPMSSITEEERAALNNYIFSEKESRYFWFDDGIWFDEGLMVSGMVNQCHIGIETIDKMVDWLNAHHFDYRGLIERGLALEAPEEMYNN